MASSISKRNAGHLWRSPMCLGDNELFAWVVKDGFRIHYRRGLGIEAVLASLLPDPDQVLAEAEIFKPGSRTHAGRIVIAGHSYFLKRYNCRGLWYRLRHLLKRSRALRTWEVSWWFFDQGVSIPEPLICMEKRCMGLLGNSYILMEFGDDTSTLRALWPTLSMDDKESLLLQIAVNLSSMHVAGCLHGDLKWDNLLIRNYSGQWQLKIVDLDGSRAPRWHTRKMAEKDLERFLRDLRKYEGDSRMVASFTERWKSCRN